MTFDLAAAASVVGICAAGIVLTGVWLAIGRSLDRAVGVFAIQAGLVGVVALAVGLATGAAHLLVGGFLAIGVRAIVVPLVLSEILRESPVRRETDPYLGRRGSLLAAIAIVFVGVAGSREAGLATSLGAPGALPAAIAAVLLGLLLMTTRRKSISIVIGLLVFDDGLALAALSLTYGMPLVIELGIAFDLLILLVVVRVYARRMLETFGSLSTDRLRNLRG
jgi:hydrogenase-4 component E